MFLQSLSAKPWKRLPSLIVFVGNLVLLPQTAIAEDQRLEAALRGLDAAMKRIDALETKVGKMSSIEEENKQLKNRLAKLETTQQPTKVIRQSRVVTIEQPQVIRPVAATITSATPETSAKEMWQGVYSGIYGGYGTGLINRSTNSVINSPYNYSGYQNSYPTVTTDTFFTDGPTVGGQVGYNYVLANQMLLGAELDVGWADILDRSSYESKTIGSLSRTAFFQIAPDPSSYRSSSTYNRIAIDWQGTARIKAGYAFGNLVAYATGGLAFGGVSSSSNDFNLNNGLGAWYAYSIINNNYGNNDKFQVGWTAGGGFEYLLNKQWSAKAEYMYVSLGGIRRENNSYAGTICSCSLDNGMPPLPLITYNNVSTGSFGIHEFRLGLNYHTDWLKNVSLNSKAP
jgi:outer membrane immunogenic protein